MVGKLFYFLLKLYCIECQHCIHVFRENDASTDRGSGSPPVVPSDQGSAGPEGLAPGTLGSARTRLPATPLPHRTVPQLESTGGTLRTRVQRAPRTRTDRRHQRPQDREGGSRQGRAEWPRQPLPDARNHERIRSVPDASQ